MKLSPNLHLTYCTNVHRGENWAQTFDSLQRFTLAVREQVCPDRPYGIGLRLSEQAARDLSDPVMLRTFRKWLQKYDCYVFTINGFPYGRFHGGRIKEQAYEPDWTTRQRVDFTNLLFELLAELLPEGCEGSVSTLPCSFKEFISTVEQEKAIREKLWQCLEHVAELSRRTGKDLHLGLEPEPLCYLENIGETISFFEQMEAERPRDPRLRKHLGINYDTCHLAVEYEDPEKAIERLCEHNVKVSKIHLSSALKVIPSPAVREALEAFAEEIYLHQVIERRPDGEIKRFKDLDLALDREWNVEREPLPEWRIHFHVPLHSLPTALFGNTSDHILGVMSVLKRYPEVCTHLEMETYTWEVLPDKLKEPSVVEQLISEYTWTLEHLAQNGFIPV